MNLDQIRYFQEAARCEHFGLAAQRLGISRSAVSHSILALEQELGCELFVRQGRSLVTSPAGKTLLSRIDPILRALGELREELVADAGEFRGTLRLAGTHFLAARGLAPAVAEFQRENPRVLADIQSLRSAQVIEGVAKGALDLGLCVSPQARAEVRTRVIQESRLLIAVGSGHPLTRVKKARERLRELDRYPAAMSRPYAGVEPCEKAHPVFKRFGISPRVQSTSDSYDIEAEQLVHSEHWALMPEFVVRAYSPRIVAIAPPPGWNASVRVTACWAADREREPLVQAFLERLKPV